MLNNLKKLIQAITETIRSCLFTFILLCLGFSALCFRNQTSKISTHGSKGTPAIPECSLSLSITDKTVSGTIAVNSMPGWANFSLIKPATSGKEIKSANTKAN